MEKGKGIEHVGEEAPVFMDLYPLFGEPLGQGSGMARSSHLLPRVICVTVGLLLTTVVAGATEPQLLVRIDGEPVCVGDSIRVQVSALGDDWKWGKLTVQVSDQGPWAVARQPRELAGTDPPVWELALVPLAVGTRQLPAMSVSVRTRSGEKATIRPAVLPHATITSVLPADEEAPAPAPLRDPIGARGLPWEWALPAFLAGLPVAALLALWTGMRRSGAPVSLGSLTPFEELGALARDLGERVARESAAAICDRLAAGLRRYLEHRIGAPAQEMTSFELRRLGRDAGWPEAVQRAVGQVMQVVDDVRFGQRVVPEAALRAAVQAALAAGDQLEAHLAAGEPGSDPSQEVVS